MEGEEQRRGSLKKEGEEENKGKRREFDLRWRRREGGIRGQRRGLKDSDGDDWRTGNGTRSTSTIWVSLIRLIVSVE